MRRILVVPEQLRALGSQMGQTARALDELEGSLARAVSQLDWEVRNQAGITDEMGQAIRLAQHLSLRCDRLAGYLGTRAEAFERADGAGLTEIGDGPLGGISERIRQISEQLGNGLPVAITAAIPIAGLGSLLGQGSGLDFASGLNRIFDGREKREEPSEVTTPASGDRFWDRIGQAPVVGEGGDMQFSPSFQTWANQFNAKLRAHWTRNPNDHAGTVGVENALNTYLLTPQKVKQLWDVAKQKHVDPRVLLAILQQEGNGSFNTNSANRSHYSGHGPQPDWEQDLAGALEGSICSKLRLYGHAVEAGFKGTWIQWVNWYTPIDNSGFKGAPGVYAADIHWGNGVERAYREIAQSLGETGNPVDEYSRWMGEHSDLFKATSIDGDFEIRQGLPPGTNRPQLAVWGGSPQPYPDAVKQDGWWWFPARDEHLWHVVKK